MILPYGFFKAYFLYEEGVSGTLYDVPKRIYKEFDQQQCRCLLWNVEAFFSAYLGLRRNF